jgi:hypothetical protein
MAKIINFINNLAKIWQLIGKNNLKFAIDWDENNKEKFSPIINLIISSSFINSSPNVPLIIKYIIHQWWTFIPHNSQILGKIIMYINNLAIIWQFIGE